MLYPIAKYKSTIPQHLAVPGTPPRRGYLTCTSRLARRLTYSQATTNWLSIASLILSEITMRGLLVTTPDCWTSRTQVITKAIRWRRDASSLCSPLYREGFMHRGWGGGPRPRSKYPRRRFLWCPLFGSIPTFSNFRRKMANFDEP